MKEIIEPIDNQLSVFDLLSQGDAARPFDTALPPGGMPVLPVTPDYNLYVLQLSQRYQTGYRVMDVIERHMTLAGFHPDAAWLFENVPGLKYYTRNNLLTPGEPLVLSAGVKGDREHVARRYEIDIEA